MVANNLSISFKYVSDVMGKHHKSILQYLKVISMIATSDGSRSKQPVKATFFKCVSYV